MNMETENRIEANAPAKEKEFSLRAVLFGCLAGLLLMVLLTYLLAVLGMDIHISPVATVLGVLLLPIFGGKVTKKEINIMQTCASAVGSSCLALPTTYVSALILGQEFRLMELLIPLLFANALGICFVTLFKNHFINDEKLPFPQSVMCRSAIDQLDTTSRKDTWALVIAIVVGLAISFAQNMGLIPPMVNFSAALPAGMTMGILLMPLMLGMGYILGPKICLVLFAASLITNVAIGPIGTAQGWFPDTKVDFSGMQYFLLPLIIGMSVVASLFPVVKQRKAFISAFRIGKDTLRGDQEDAALFKKMLVMLAVCAVGFTVVCCLFYGVNILHMLLIMVLSLVFSMVAVQVNAESGMSVGFALTTLQIFIVYLLTKNVTLSLIMACLVFTVTGLSMDTMADLKTGQFVKASPKKQVWAQYIGIAVGSICGVLFFYSLIKTYGLQDPRYAFPIGQMNAAVAGSFGGEGGVMAFHLGRFGIGAVLGGVLALLHLPVGAIAVAMYLAPTTIMGTALGGLIRFIVEKAKGKEAAGRLNNVATGLVVGDALAAAILIFLVMMGG